MDAPSDVHPGAATMAVDCSVIIPAYRGGDLIADCISAVEHATRGRHCEIIVVESSGDHAREVIRDRFPAVTLLTPANPLPVGAARNHGAAAARGRLLFFVDQDCTVPPDWIARLERHLADPAVGAAGGSISVRNPRNISGLCVYCLEFFEHLPGRSPPRRDAPFLLGCNLACRAEVFRGVRFPEQTLGEDVLFSHAIRAAGFDLLYDPAIEVRHHNRTGWGEFFRYNVKMGRAAAATHARLGLPWAAVFLRYPILVYLTPAVMMPRIAARMARSSGSALATFLLLAPICLMGNLVWAHAFRLQALTQRRGR